MDLDEIRKEVAKIRWFHRIDLGQGIVTPGLDDSPERARTLMLPEDLRGWSVLDVGAWDGYFSFEMERRGASHVLATDRFSWGGGGWGSKAGFELARRVLTSKVEDKFIDVLELSPESVGTFDLVLFLGVLYHMRHPLLSLERVASVTRRMLVLETHADMLACGRPAMAFYPADELNEDSTNWWGPNPAAVRAMLEAVGFRRVELVFHRSLFDRLGRAIKWRVKGRPFWPSLQQSRVVFQAWK
jgi:tRNA (mo5U34)-methyltransferase